MSTYEKDLRPLILPSCQQQTHFSAQETPMPPSQTKTSSSKCRLSLSPILSHSQTLENQKAVVSKKVHKTKRKEKILENFEQKKRKIRPGRAFFFYASIESNYEDFFKTWRWSYLSRSCFSLRLLNETRPKLYRRKLQ
jgi:hypothetical protein